MWLPDSLCWYAGVRPPSIPIVAIHPWAWGPPPGAPAAPMLLFAGSVDLYCAPCVPVCQCLQAFGLFGFSGVLTAAPCGVWPRVGSCPAGETCIIGHRRGEYSPLLTILSCPNPRPCPVLPCAQIRCGYIGQIVIDFTRMKRASSRIIELLFASSPIPTSTFYPTHPRFWIGSDTFLPSSQAREIGRFRRSHSVVPAQVHQGGPAMR